MNFNEALTFVTRFVNKAADVWRVYEKGRDFVRIPAGEELEVESYKATTDWARWSEAVKKPDGSLVLKENPRWMNPWADKICIELVNKDGSDEESLAVTEPNPLAGANGYISAVKGIPLLVPLDVWDPLCKYSKIIWERKPVKIKIEGTSYSHDVMEVVKTCVPRSKAELKKILKERARIEEERIRRESDAAMKKQEKLLLDEEK